MELKMVWIFIHCFLFVLGSDEKHSSVKLTVFVQSCTWTLTAPVSLTEEIEVSVLTLDHIAVSTCPIIPNSTHPCVRN